jgi:hypothetical protein
MASETCDERIKAAAGKGGHYCGRGLRKHKGEELTVEVWGEMC